MKLRSKIRKMLPLDSGEKKLRWPQASVFFKFCRDESGNYAILTAILMPALLGAGGLATDYGLWLKTRQQMQNVADAAAYSAAIAVTNGNGNATTQANAV